MYSDCSKIYAVKFIPHIFNLVACVQDALLLYLYPVDIFMQAFKEMNEELMGIMLTTTQQKFIHLEIHTYIYLNLCHYTQHTTLSYYYPHTFDFRSRN